MTGSLNEKLADLIWAVSEPIRHAMNALPANATTAASGALVILAAVTLALAAKMAGPDMRAFPCGPRFIRIIAGFTATSWFIRGCILLGSLSGPEARHAHWDLLMGSAGALALVGSVFGYVLSRRMPVGFWDRFAFRDAVRLVRARAHLDGTVSGDAFALMEASGERVAGPGEGPGAMRASDLTTQRILKAVRT